MAVHRALPFARGCAVAGGLGLALALFGVGCSSAPSDGAEFGALEAGVEALALDGSPLRKEPVADPERRSLLEQDLAEARAAYAADPRDADAILGMGLRLADLGEFRAAVGFFTEGIAKHPYDARFWGHRGHRWITLRTFDRAVEDLRHAAALVEGEPDRTERRGAPNTTRSSLRTLRASIAHDLAFAHFLRGEYAEAAALHERRLAEAANDDQVCASAYGLVLALHRLGDEAGVRRVLARIPPDMDVVERRDEHRVLRILSGQPAPEGPTAEPGGESAATIGYGLAQERLFAGDRDGAVRRLREVVEGTPWAAFGHVAAEADLADPSRLDGNGARGR